MREGKVIDSARNIRKLNMLHVSGHIAATFYGTSHTHHVEQ